MNISFNSIIVSTGLCLSLLCFRTDAQNISTIPISNQSQVSLSGPNGIVIDSIGNIYVCDAFRHSIKKLDIVGNMSIIAGTGTNGYSGNGGNAISAQFDSPRGLAIDKDGNLFVSDTYNHVIRKISKNGIVSLYAGTPDSAGYSGDGGLAINAKINTPEGLCFDNAGNLYVAEHSNHIIRKIAANGLITTIAGNGTEGNTGLNGPAINATLSEPNDIAIDANGNLFIADSKNAVVKKVNTAGIISIYAGNGTMGNSGNGGNALVARLNYPMGLKTDNNGNLIIADTQNNTLRKVNNAGIISQLAGNGNAEYSGDEGAAINAGLFLPMHIAFDKSGNILFTDSGNNVVRKITVSN